jgi:tetratricopeptide (TPR) repeat protein
MAEGEFAQVRKYMDIALALGKEIGWIGDHDLYAMLADAAAQVLNSAALKQYAPLAEEMAVRYDHKLYQAIVHRAWGVAHRLDGENDAAEVRFTQALEIFKTLGTRWQIGRTLYELGELASSQGNNAAAREHFSDALTAFEEVGALPNSNQAREKLLAL